MRIRKTMVYITVILALFIPNFSFGFEAVASGRGWSEDQRDIWDLEEKYWAYLKNTDIEGYKDLLHQDSLPWPSGSYLPVIKPQTILYIKRWFKFDPILSYELEPHAIQIIHNVAVVCYSYEFKGEKHSDNGRITHTWLRQNGIWKMIGGMNASHVLLPRHKKIK